MASKNSTHAEQKIADKNSTLIMLLAMEETARAVAAEPPSPGDSTVGKVSPLFLRQLNSLLRQVNTLVPGADLVLYDEANLYPISTSYPKSVEVLHQLKMAISLLGGTSGEVQSGPSRGTDAPKAAAEKVSVFIGCSVEGLKIAKVIQMALAHRMRPVIWHQGIFGLSRGTLESLVAKVHEFQYAILVLTPDDLILKRGETTPVARDNVLFELGLFMGALGRDRTFIVCERSVVLPSDLAGITPATYESSGETSLVADLGPVCTKLEIEMGVL